jgi:hypothetical protein
MTEISYKLICMKYIYVSLACEKMKNIFFLGQKFLTNWFVRDFIQHTYKIDMCPFTYEKHMLF